MTTHRYLVIGFHPIWNPFLPNTYGLHKTKDEAEKAIEALKNHGVRNISIHPIELPDHCLVTDGQDVFQIKDRKGTKLAVVKTDGKKAVDDKGRKYASVWEAFDRISSG